MPGRRSSAGQRRARERKLTSSQDQWRRAPATEVVEAGGLVVNGGNGFIDPNKSVGKLKNHGKGLWRVQALVAFIMSVVAVVTDTRYGLTYWYTNTVGGGKLRDMQYVWAFFNTICAVCGVWVYMLWNEAVAGVHRDRKVFRQKAHPRYLKPLVTQARRKDRLLWAKQWVVTGSGESRKFYHLENLVHIDEKWFYVCKEGQRYYLFSDEVHIWMSYFTWAFGIWTTAVVFVSFKTYSFSGNYPTDLTCAFLGATLCCVLSDTWALGKLCSLGTYAAQLEEEWRLLPHESSAPPKPDLAQDLESASKVGIEEVCRAMEGERKRSRGGINDGNDFLAGRRASGSGSVVQAPGAREGGHGEYDPACGFKQTVETVAISEEDVLMPHAFERLWSALDTQGEFETQIGDAVTQSTVVRHLSDLGFQVVAAGTVDSLMRVLFCAKEATHNGTGAWFLAELAQNEETLTLEAIFKSKSPSVVPGFVKSLMLQSIFTMDAQRC